MKRRDVVDHQPARQALQHRLVQRQLAAVELQVDVPAERRDRRCRALEARPRQHAARQHHVADAARAEVVKGIELGARRLGRDDDDRARFRAERGDGRERATVVEAVAGRLDDDRAGEVERRAGRRDTPTPAHAAA